MDEAADPLPPHDPRHWARLAPYLAALGAGVGRVLAYRPLQTGISGADTYRLYTAEGEVFLKLTAAGKGRVAQERAARESAFYQELAGHIPLRVPRLLGAPQDAAGSALLLAVYRPAPPPADWPAADYCAAAVQLAHLHVAYWDRADALAVWPWLARRTPADDAADNAQAATSWRALHDQSAGVLDAEEFAWLCRLLDVRGAARTLIDALPPTLCHGDANPWNVLRDADGAFVWTDWQEVSVARGPEDLAFFMQRATVAGGAVPVEDMLAAYHATLAAEGIAVALAAIRQAVEAAELWSRALYWPAYLTGAPPAALAAMLARIHDLARRLGIGG